MKRIVLIALFLLAMIAPVQADNSDKATPQEVYDLVLKAYNVVKNLGAEAFPAFNTPQSEFIYKDTLVLVMKCPSEMVAHPFIIDQMRGQDISRNPQTIAVCKSAANPKGEWVELFYPKPGEKEPSRLVNFALSVEGTPYQVVAGIFNDPYSIEQLNKTLH